MLAFLIRRVLLGALMFTATACAGPAQHVVALYEAGDYTGAARVADQGLAANPGDEALRQMRVRVALALGDAAGVADAYAAYQGALGGDDRPLLRELAIATLGQALASPSAKLKLAAIQAVAAAELEPLADQVAERMADDDDRVAAAAAIAVLRGYAQAPKLAGDMLHSEEPEARRIAVDGIGQKVGKLAIADLRSAAGDPDARVRGAALRWLGELEDGGAVELLVRGVRDGDATVRAQALSALARLVRAGKAGGTELVDPKREGALPRLASLVDLAAAALDDPALAVRLAGVELLAAARSPDARARLVRIAGDANGFVATEAAIAAGGGAPAAEALARAAASGDWTVRAGAANIATRAVGKPGAVVLARKLTADPVVAVQLAAARVIAGAGDRAAAAAIFAAALQHPEHRLAAAIDLALQNDARGPRALELAVRDAELGPAGRAAAAAAHRTARRLTPGLVAALADDSGVVRVEAAAAIAMLTTRD